MTEPRDYAWGAVAGVVVLGGYAISPSGTFFEWTAVGLGFVLGAMWALLTKRLLPWNEIRGLIFGGVFLAVCGVAARMWLNDFTFLDTVLLTREEKYVWSMLLPVGYWIIAGTAGYALVAAVRASPGDRHAPRAD